MARLRRIHLTSVGHKDARFFPVTIDLRDAFGAGSDAVLWLRNGGGKSSLLNLYFSIFQPRLTRFLGAKAEHKERALTDYVKATDTAFVVTEWEIESQGVDTAPLKVRIVGQVMAWKGRQVSSKTSQLDRYFFSCRAGANISFDALPILGLGTHVSSLQAFRDWFAEAAKAHPELDFFMTDNQTRWIDFLEKRDLDPEVFSYQLKMNQREGGAADLFKIGTPFDFIDLFLEIAFDPEKADLLSGNLRTHREKLNRLPALRLELDFLAALRAEIEPFAAESVGLRGAEEALEREMKTARRIHSALSASISRKEALKVADELRLETLKKERNDKSNEAERYRKYHDGYQRRRRDLSYEEAKRHEEICRLAFAVAETEVAVCRAAALLKKVRAYEAEMSALREQKSLADEKRRPAEDALKRFGAIYRALVSRDAAVVADRITAETTLEAEAEEGVSASSKERENAIREQTRAASRVGELKKSMDAHDKRRAELRDAGNLEPRESGQDAIGRWKQERERCTDREAVIKTDRIPLVAEAEALLEEIRQHSAMISRLEEQMLSAKSRCDDGEAETHRLKLNPILREALESEDPDLDFPDLPQRLTSMRQRAQTALIDIELDGVEDKRSIRAVEENGLLPAARDVVRLIETMRANGAKSAVSAYKFLADNLPSDEARAAIQADPARFSGAMLQNAGEWEALRAEGAPGADGLAQPVMLSLTGRPDCEAPTARVVVPSATGCYSYAEAQTAVRLIETRDGERRVKAETFNTRFREVEASAHGLRAFLERYGGGKLQVMREAFATAQNAAVATRQREADARTKLGRTRDQIQALEDEAAVVKRDAQRAETTLIKLENFERDYGQHFTAWEAGHREMQTTALQIEQRISEFDQRLADLRAKANAARERAQQLRIEAHDFAKALESIRYDSGESDPDIGGATIEQARSRYEVSVAQFDQRFGDDRISGQIEQIEKQHSAHNAEYNAAALNLATERIEATAQRPDLAAHAAEAGAEQGKATGVLALAVNAVKLAQADLPGPQPYKTGADLPPGAQDPATAAEALARAEEMRGLKENIDRRIAELGEEIDALKTALATLTASITTRKALLDSLNEYGGLSQEDESLPVSDEETRRIVSELRDQLSVCERESNQRSLKLDSRFRRFQLAVHDDQFIAVQAVYKTKMAQLERDELRAECDSYLLQVDARQVTIRKDIDQCQEHKRIIISNLEAVCREVAALLRRAERESRLPDSIKGWAGQPFLRLNFELPEDRAEFHVKLDALIERLVRAEIPGGLPLACLAFREIAPNVRVTLLKPESNLRPERHDITEFGGFSGGEKLTAAILLYCTLVRLRAQSRSWFKGDPRAGVLILDNPVGISSKEEFIQLQLDLARQMGVQLLYTTGVNDVGALRVLPMVVRLRNQTRDRATGDLLVDIDPVSSASTESKIEGARVVWRV
jgi:hypothetical protein